MKFGAVFPQTEIGNDPIAIRDYAQAVEGLGYDHLIAYDHVLGANTANRPDWKGPYTHQHPFHEIFVLFGYLAGLTRTIELVTSVVILPQRQTTLVAKQAAEVDVLSGGRLRLGVGIGWNAVEYEALNQDFHTRGARIEEQVKVLRALWTQPLVTFHGESHQITEAGLNPLPIQQPIPIWFGGHAEPMLKRAGRLADGWFPLSEPGDEARNMIERLHSYAREAGRSPNEIGIEAVIKVTDGTEDTLRNRVAGWIDLGATHLCVNTMRAGFRSPQEHIDTLQRMRKVLGIAG